MLRALVLSLLLCGFAFAQKVQVKVINHTVDGVPFTLNIPGVVLRNGNASATCGAYGNQANCSAGSTGTDIYAPAHSVQGTLAHIEMLLLLPDGRRAGVYCNDHFGSFAQSHRHNCKNPEVDALDADFSGDKVRLTWGVGLDGKRKSLKYLF